MCSRRQRGMKAFVITGRRACGVQDVAPPTAGPGQAVVDVERAGLCGTDVEFFTGEMAYLHQGHARFPMRIGHEWCGTVSAVGDGVDPAWLGRRTTGDTMLGCGRCHRCLTGREHVCDDRFEIGVRGGWPGALAEQVAVPVTALHPLPDPVDLTAGALVEPGGSALRAVQASCLAPGDRVLVLGPGTSGLLGAWTAEQIPGLAFDAVIDCTNAAALPGLAVDIVEPGKRVVYVGLAASPSLVDTRTMVLKDVTAVGILSASPGLAGTIERYASGAVDPRPLVCATVGLAEVGEVLAGSRPPGAGPGPKVLVDPRPG